MATGCVISVPPSMLKPERAPYIHWLMLHEVWHCFEARLLPAKAAHSAPKWVSEGQASWVAEAITNGAGAPPPEADQDHWRGWLTDPAKTLYARSYDAVGFWAQLAYSGTESMDDHRAELCRGGDQGESRWALDRRRYHGGARRRLGFELLPKRGPQRSVGHDDAFGILPAGIRPAPKSVAIADGDEATITAGTNSAAVADLNLTAFVTQVDVSGFGRVGSAGGYDRVLHTAPLETQTIYLCTTNSGDCSCPAGSEPIQDKSPEAIPGQRHGAVTGRDDGTSFMHLRGLSKDEWCRKKASPGPQTGGSPCGGAGCGGSNGDPHLKTVNGAKYDLQAAGEYVLLRSGDGSIEIQAREEPPCLTGGASPPPSFGSNCQATINTAIAVKENGHRVGFYVSGDVPTVHVEGKPVDASQVASADLGTGTTLARYRRGYELDLPDGTKVWALSLGSFGINLLVKPSTPLFSSGVGLIAQVPTTAKLRVPALPDGTTLPSPLDAHDRYHQLYEVFAPAWRVTAATSLFDYEPGKTSASYVVAAYPPEQAPQTTQDLDPAVLAQARSSCSAVTDADLADQCAYDTAVTGDTRFATLYAASEQLQTVGTSTLDLAPGATPPPSAPPAGGGSASGVNLVEDHLTNTGASAVGFHTLGPDGTIYVEVGEAGQSFGDVTTALLAIDGSSGKVKQRATPTGGGALAFAAGSLWADAFKRPDNGCAVSRLDPVTLAVQATVATVCSANGPTAMVPFGDALWFVDPTGADANGTGGHLRRIDPTTNKVDSSPSGSVEMPFVSPFLGVFGSSSLLAPTSAGVILGDNQHGYYRLANGSSTFDSLGNPATGYHPFPAADGLWVQTDVGTQDQPDSTAAFYNGGATAARQLTVKYFLIGADDTTVYTGYVLSDDQADGLWSNPVDGSPPTRIATAAFVPTSSGTDHLTYQDPTVPLMIGDHVVVKLWVAPSPTNADTVALYEQSVPVP